MKVPRLYDIATPPPELGYEGGGFELRVWLNPPATTINALFDAFTEEGRAARARAYHEFLGTSAPQTVEVEGPNGQIVTVGIDFTTEAAARTTLDRDDLPDDLAAWIASLPATALAKRREFINNTLPLSFQKTSPR